MDTASACIAFDEYSERLVESVSARDEVLGLVLVGSGGDRSRIDEWSDHDFFLITTPDAAEEFRQNLSWLPDQQSIVLAPRETDHGLKVVYADGHVLEFAVATLAELATFASNSWTVLLDRGGVETTMLGLPKTAPGHSDGHDDRGIQLFVSLLLIGTGRARRGEVIVAGGLVRQWALDHLLRVWRHRLPSPDAARLDTLDVQRRFEFVYPEVGGRIAAILRQDPETAARELLELAEEHLAAGWDHWPTAGVAAVRQRLGW
jgi:hypothetical protein